MCPGLPGKLRLAILTFLAKNDMIIEWGENYETYIHNGNCRSYERFAALQIK